MPAPILAPTLMRAARVVFLDAASLGTDIDFAGLGAAADRLQRHALTPAGEVSARLAGANVAICNKTPLDAHVFDQVPTLELVLVTATGVNNIDLAAAAMHGVDVRHCRAYGTASVAQHTLMLMLALHTGFLDYQRDVAAGRWQRADSFCLLDHPIRELAGQTLGICGRGAIGSAVAELARAFGMRVVFAQLPGRPARADALPWHEFLQQIDVLSLHCPLTEATRHLIDAPALARLRPGAFLVNTARADLVDAGALLDSLHRGHLGGAAFDGLAREPPPPDEPLLAARLPNLVITPHNAWASRQARQRLLNQTVENLLAWRRGEVLRRVVAGH
jgi:glycerate dehydrogenase